MTATPQAIAPPIPYPIVADQLACTQALSILLQAEQLADCPIIWKISSIFPRLLSGLALADNAPDQVERAIRAYAEFFNVQIRRFEAPPGAKARTTLTVRAQLEIGFGPRVDVEIYGLVPALVIL